LENITYDKPKNQGQKRFRDLKRGFTCIFLLKADNSKQK
jgi:hypothetical protein